MPLAITIYYNYKPYFNCFSKPWIVIENSTIDFLYLPCPGAEACSLHRLPLHRGQSEGLGRPGKSLVFFWRKTIGNHPLKWNNHVWNVFVYLQHCDFSGEKSSICFWICYVSRKCSIMLSNSAVILRRVHFPIFRKIFYSWFLSSRPPFILSTPVLWSPICGFISKKHGFDVGC